MRRTQKGVHKGWLRRHLYSITCVAAAIILFAGSITWYAVTTNAAIERQQASTLQAKADSEKLAQQVKEKQARLAAEA